MAAAGPLNFQSHCIFCLQRQAPGEHQQVVESNTKNIKDFQPILNYLTGTDPTFDKGVEECLKRNIPVMGNLPPMCQDCYDMIGELHGFHQLLLSVQCSIQKQVNLIRKKVMEAEGPSRHNHTPSEPCYSIEKSSWKKFNNRITSSGMNQSQIASVMKFINSLHDAIIEPDSSQVIYPSKPTPVEGVETGKNMSNSTSASASLPLLVTSPVVTQTNSVGSALSRAKRKRKRPPQPSRGLPRSRPSEVLLILPDDSEIKYENEDSDEDEDEFAALNNFLSSDQDAEIRSGEKEEKKTGKAENKRKEALQAKIKKLLPALPLHKTQTCDLCGKRYRLEDIAKHLRIHVKDYVTKCVNPSCPFWYSCHYKMEEHIKKQYKGKGNQSYFCAPKPDPKRSCRLPSCSFETGRVEHFRDHLAHHEKEIESKTFSCPIPECSQVFGLRESVEFHIFLHNLRPPPPAKTHQECSICKGGVKIEEMRGHLKEKHAISEVVPCKFCNFVFPSDRLALIEHLWKEHNGADGISCDICGEDDGVKFVRQATLREHYSIAHNVGELQTFVCEHCSMELSNETGLRAHITRKHPEHVDKLPPPRKSDISNKCEMCPHLGAFKNYQELFSHKVEIHKKPVKQYDCKHCDETFRFPALLRKHLAKFHGAAARIFKCSKPGCEEKTFSERAGLKRHIIKTHPEPGQERPFRCDKCEKGYWDRKTLVYHQQSVHERIRPYICDTCGEGFTSSTSLKRHNFIHTGERPYPCPICNQPFRQRETLSTHLRSHKERGDDFKPSGPAKKIRKRVDH